MASAYGKIFWTQPGLSTLPRYCRVHFDGSWKDEFCGSGWVAYGSNSPGDGDQNWHVLAWMAFPAKGRSVTVAELEALASAQMFITTLLLEPTAAHITSMLCNYEPWEYVE
eukprot:70836-Karenia_brevis.AAC.1